MLRQTRGACKQALIQSQRLFGCPAWIQIRRNTFPVSISSLAFTAQLIHQESGEAESSCSAGLTPTHLDLLDRFASLDVNPDKQRGGELEQRLSFIPPYLPDTQSRYLSSGAGAGWGGWFLSDTWHMVLTGPNTPLLSVKAPQQARHSPTTSLMRAELVNWAWNFWTSPQHHWSMLFCPERETRACWSGALDSSQQVNTATWGRGVFTCDRPAFFLRLTFTKQVVVFSSLLLFLFFLQILNVWLCFQGCISLFLFIPRLCLWLDECMFDTGSGIWMPRGCRTSTVGQSVSRMCTLTQSSARSEVGGWRMVNHCKRTTERKCVCGGMAFTGSNRKLAAAFRWQKYN